MTLPPFPSFSDQVQHTRWHLFFPKISVYQSCHNKAACISTAMKAHPPAGLLIASAILQRTSINEDGTPTSPTFSTSPFNVNPTTSPTSIKKLLNEDAEPPRNAIDEATSPLPIQLPRNLFSTSKPSTSTTLPSTARRNFMRIPLSFNPRLRVQRMGNGKTGGVEGSMSQDDGETDGVEDSMSQDEEYNDTLETTNKGTTKALKDTGYSESHDILTPDPHIEILNAPVPSHPSFQRDTQSVSPVEEQLDDDEDYTQPDMRFCRRRESIDTASSGEDHEEDSRPRGILGMFRQRLRDPDMDEEVEEPDHEVPAFHSHPNVLDLPLGISAASYPSRMTVTVPMWSLRENRGLFMCGLFFVGSGSCR
ncbi:hypothetical protein BC829DRAFT_168788 [Chytridium lagenaria]|nr:hypothetical protein BC829DRAFT_168788 [Chytridium lagenaria]